MSKLFTQRERNTLIKASEILTRVFDEVNDEIGKIESRLWDLETIRAELENVSVDLEEFLAMNINE